MAETAPLSRFEVTFDVEGRNEAKFRNDITVHLRGPHPASVDLPTDEGPYHGGDGTAPYPLAYFASGLTACIIDPAARLCATAGDPADNGRGQGPAALAGAAARARALRERAGR